MQRALGAIHPDWQTIEAGNMDEALEAVDKNAFDLMFIDVNMPGKDGLTLSEELRHRYPDTPMTLVTANVQASVQDRAGELGVGVIGKPINREKLEEYLNRVFGTDD